MGLLKEKKLYNTVMPDHYFTTPQTVTTTTRDDEIRIRKDCIWQLFVDKKTYTLPDGNNAQEVCTNSSCKCMTKGEQGNFFEPDVADTGGRGVTTEECEVGGKPRPGWENYNPNSDEPGTDLPKDWTVEDLFHWRCQNQLESEGWPKGTKFKRWQWQQNRRMCTCYVACKDELGNDDPDGRMCMCEPNTGEVDENGEYYTNCTLDTSIPLDHPGMVGSEMNTDPNEGAVNESEDPVTEQEMRDSYFSHMHSWAASPPCQGCEMFGAYTWDPKKDGELKWTESDGLVSWGEPPPRRKPISNPIAHQKARVSEREAKAFYQSSQNLSVTGGPRSEAHTVPSTYTTTTTTTTTEPPPNDCCVLVNMNAFMFKLKLIQDIERRPIDPYAPRRMTQTWECEGEERHKAEKVCLAERERRNVEIKPEEMDDRPNPPLCVNGMFMPPNPETGEQLKTIRWKPEKFVVACEEGETEPSYQFHCDEEGGLGDGCPEPSHEKRLFLFKAKWEPCGKPCLADPTECECLKTNSSSFSFEVKVDLGGDNILTGGLVNAAGESATDNFLEQVVDAINENGMKQTSCQCKPARPVELTVPNVGNTLIEIASLFDPMIGTVMDRASDLVAIWDIIKNNEMPPNSQGGMC